MNLYCITQPKTINEDIYDSAIVCSETEEEAKNMHPNGFYKWNTIKKAWSTEDFSWTTPRNVSVELIGTAINQKKGVVLASFNAG